MKLTNYIITHKPFTPPADPSYVPLQVGFGEDFGFLRDNTNENIAAKNANWCELTGIYWIWKNDQTSDYIGISHYRRYFEKKGAPEIGADALALLKDCDVLIAEFEPYRQSVYEQYAIESGFAKDLDTVRDIIQEKYPRDVKAFDAVMAQGGLSQYNMMIASKEIYDDYCSWLFSILEEAERRIDLTGYNDYQKRIFGFISERLLNVYVLARHLNVRHMPILQTEMSTKDRMRLSLRRQKNRLLFSLSNSSSNSPGSSA